MQINFVQILFQIINFTILLVLLRKYLYRPILKILEQRARKIHEGLEAAEKSIQEREKLEMEKKKILVGAEKTASEILEGARIRSKKIEKDLTEKSQKEEEARAKRAQERTRSQLKQMEKELNRRFASTVIDTTETLLSDSLGTAQHREILDNQIARLKKIKFSS